MQLSQTVPDGAIVVNPVEFQLIRKAGQPSPSDFGVPTSHTYNVGKRTRPHEPPRSRMHIPKTRGLTGEQLWELRCSVLPKHQNWCLVWIFFVPNEPGSTFKSIKIVFVGVYKNREMAASAQIHARGMYPNRASMLSRVGFWQALPVPRWLESDAAHDEYNGDIIKRLIDQDTKKTRIEHEVLRRRAKAAADIEADPPEIASEKVESAVYGESRVDEDDDEIKDSGDSKPVDIWVSLDGKGLVPKKQRIGLAWVLPSVQRRGRDLREVAVAWLGTFRSVTEANNQQKLIKDKHPEWDVHSFFVGEPIDLPVPIWELQKREQVQYNQEMLGDFMRSNPTIVEDDDPIIEPPDMGDGRTVEDDVMEQTEADLVNAIIPTPPVTQGAADQRDDLIKVTAETKDLGNGLKIKMETFAPRATNDVTVPSELGSP